MRASEGGLSVTLSYLRRVNDCGVLEPGVVCLSTGRRTPLMIQSCSVDELA